MEPPSYEEASLQPSPFTIGPPPYYHGPLTSPPTPPPTYGEAVSICPNPFPVLTFPTAQTSQSYHGTVIHPVTQISVARPGGSRQPQPAAVVVTTQPAPVPVLVTHLGDIPGLVRCPYCQTVVTTKVKHVPGLGAWSLCVFITLMGLICGFCLIPLMMRSLQDVHHYCPQCESRLHVHLK